MDNSVVQEDPEPPSTVRLSDRAFTLSNPATPLRRPASDAGRAGAARRGSERGQRFPIGADAQVFRGEFYPEASPRYWNDWRWEVRHRIRDLRDVLRVFDLSDEERNAIALHQGPLPLGITPYYASLMSRADSGEPLRRTHIPVMGEYLRLPGEEDDPLAEDTD